MSDVKIKVIDSDKLINAINEGSYDVNLSAVMAFGAAMRKESDRYNWIPVSKHMPEEQHGYFSTGIHYSDDLLVTILDVEAGESFLGMGYTCDGAWYLTSKQGYLTDEKIEQDMKYKVTAWAELLEPYVLTAEEREAMEKETK